MVVGIDIRALARGNRTGVEEYILNLLPHLFILAPETKFKLFYNSWQKVPLNQEWLALSNVEVKEFRIPNRPLSFSAKYFNWPSVDEMIGGADVFFSPHFLFSATSKKCQHVITFHDLSFEYFPELFSLKHRFWHWSVDPRGQARKADKIIAVSQSTKDDLAGLYQIPPEKISVIHSGIGEEFRLLEPGDKNLREIKIKYHLPEKFILYLGTLEPRKNLVGLIRAFEIFKEKYAQGDNKDIKLVLAGSRGWLYEEIFKAAKASKFSQDIIFSGFVAPDDKVYLYNQASLFVYPSFFEGFGFPPLEAMACGVPVITSNTSSLPEIVDSGGLLISPYNFGELAWVMKEFLNDKELREMFIARGLERAKNFSWQNCARTTLDVLTKL